MSKDTHRITVAELGQFVEQLGIDWKPRDLRSIEILPGKVTVTRYRVDHDGHRIALPGGNECATEVTIIAVVDQ